MNINTIFSNFLAQSEEKSFKEFLTNKIENTINISKIQQDIESCNLQLTQQTQEYAKLVESNLENNYIQTDNLALLSCKIADTNSKINNLKIQIDNNAELIDLYSKINNNESITLDLENIEIESLNNKIFDNINFYNFNSSKVSNSEFYNCNFYNSISKTKFINSKIIKTNFFDSKEIILFEDCYFCIPTTLTNRLSKNAIFIDKGNFFDKLLKNHYTSEIAENIEPEIQKHISNKEIKVIYSNKDTVEDYIDQRYNFTSNYQEISNIQVLDLGSYSLRILEDYANFLNNYPLVRTLKHYQQEYLNAKDNTELQQKIIAKFDELRRPHFDFTDFVKEHDLVTKHLPANIDQYQLVIACKTEINQLGLMCDLEFADFNKVEFRNIIIAGKSLFGSNFNNCNLVNVGFNDTPLFKKIKGFFGKNDIDYNNLCVTKFLNCNILNNNFKDTNISNSLFEETLIIDSNFDNSIFNNTIINSCKLVQTSFNNAKIISSVVNKTNIVLSTMNKLLLEQSNLTNVDIEKSELINSRFSLSQITNVDFKECNLSSFNSIKNNICDCVMQISNLSNSSFDQDNIENLTIYNSNLTKANLALNKMHLFKILDSKISNMHLYANKVIDSLINSNIDQISIDFKDIEDCFTFIPKIIENDDSIEISENTDLGNFICTKKVMNLLDISKINSKINNILKNIENNQQIIENKIIEKEHILYGKLFFIKEMTRNLIDNIMKFPNQYGYVINHFVLGYFIKGDEHNILIFNYFSFSKNKITNNINKIHDTIYKGCNLITLKNIAIVIGIFAISALILLALNNIIISELIINTSSLGLVINTGITLLSVIEGLITAYFICKTCIKYNFIIKQTEPNAIEKQQIKLIDNQIKELNIEIGHANEKININNKEIEKLKIIKEDLKINDDLVEVKPDILNQSYFRELIINRNKITNTDLQFSRL